MPSLPSSSRGCLSSRRLSSESVDATIGCNVQLGEAYHALLFEDYFLDVEIGEANVACDEASSRIDSYNAAYR